MHIILKRFVDEFAKLTEARAASGNFEAIVNGLCQMGVEFGGSRKIKRSGWSGENPCPRCDEELFEEELEEPYCWSCALQLHRREYRAAIENILMAIELRNPGTIDMLVSEVQKDLARKKREIFWRRKYAEQMLEMLEGIGVK